MHPVVFICIFLNIGEAEHLSVFTDCVWVIHLKLSPLEPGMVAHTFDSSIQEAEAGGSM